MTNIVHRINMNYSRSIACKHLIIALALASVASAIQAGTPGDFVSLTRKDNTVILNCEQARIRLELCAVDTVRISLAGNREEFPPNEPYLVMRYDWPLVPKEIQETEKLLIIKTDALLLEVEKKPFRLSFYSDGKKRLLTQTAFNHGFEIDAGRRICRMKLDAGGKTEHFFGLGMQFWRCDLRGTSRNMKMAAFYSAREEGEGETHYVNPFLLSTAGYGIYLHSSSISRFELGSTVSNEYSFQTPMGGLDFYVIADNDLSKIVSRFSEISGRIGMPPRYSLGLSYRGVEKDGTGEQLLKSAKAFRAANIPLDLIGTEPTWQTKRVSHVWNPNYAKDPKALIQSINALHIQVNLWERGEFIAGMMPDYESLVPYSSNALADLTLKPARDLWFAGSRACAFDLGAQGFKVDENDHWQGIPGKKMPGGLPHELYENLHPMLMQQNYWDQCKSAFNRRYFGWSRGNFTGGQRVPVAGYTDASDFMDYIRATVNCGFWGAYFCPEYRLTNDRTDQRIQMMFFGPFALDNEWITGAMPISKSGKPHATYLEYAQLRYRLIPYIYSYFRHQNKTGIPIIRHTLMEFPNDPRSWQQDFQYFFGRDLLVAPLYANPRPLYLPEGIWIDYWTGERYVGGRSLVFESKNMELPLFVRSGAIMPMQPAMNYAGEKPLDPLTIEISPGNSSGFVFYDDDGITLDYEKGAFAEIPFAVSSLGSEITLSMGALHAPGAYRPAIRTVVVKALSGVRPVSVTVNNTPLNPLAPEAVSGTDSGWWYADERQGTMYARFPFAAGASEIKIRLAAPIDYQPIYQKAYDDESRRSNAKLAELSQGGPKTKALATLIASAQAEAGRLVQSRGTIPQAIILLNTVVQQVKDLQDADQVKPLMVRAKDSCYIWSGVKKEANFSGKAELCVKHDSTSPDGKILALLKFPIADIKVPVKKAFLALACNDASKPLPGHDAIHAMLFACPKNIDLVKCTWASFNAEKIKLEPIVDFFPAKDETQPLDVTAAFSQAIAEKRTDVIFVIECIDEMGAASPLLFPSARYFANKAKIPVLILHPDESQPGCGRPTKENSGK